MMYNTRKTRRQYSVRSVRGGGGWLFFGRTVASRNDDTEVPSILARLVEGARSFKASTPELRPDLANAANHWESLSSDM